MGSVRVTGFDGTKEVTDRMNIPNAIAGIPVDNATNREHALKLGVDWVAAEVPPGSVPMQCANCDGALDLDPQSVRIRNQLMSAGREPPVVCVTCAFSFGMGKAKIGHSELVAIEQFKAKLRLQNKDADRQIGYRGNHLTNGQLPGPGITIKCRTWERRDTLANRRRPASSLDAARAGPQINEMEA